MDPKDLRGPLASESVEFAWALYDIEQHQTYYVVDVENTAVTFAHLEEVEVATTLGYRWWTLVDLRDTAEHVLDNQLEIIENSLADTDLGSHMASSGSEQSVTVDGHVIKLTNLDKVLYPVTGTTKADVIGYYAEIAAIMLPHVIDRPATRKRWPDGVGDGSFEPTVFFNKDLAKGTPDWVTRFKIAHRDHDNYYPAVNDLATLTWLGQLAALEIHVPQWRFGEERPAAQPRSARPRSRSRRGCQPGASVPRSPAGRRRS